MVTSRARRATSLARPPGFGSVPSARVPSLAERWHRLMPTTMRFPSEDEFWSYDPSPGSPEEELKIHLQDEATDRQAQVLLDVIHRDPTLRQMVLDQIENVASGS